MPRFSVIWTAVLVMTSALAGAAEFRAATEPAVVLYDAPSVKARKMFIVNRGYPLEVVVQVEGWSKVRDATGALSWIETRLLEKTRNVLVKPETAVARQQADDNAPAVFEVQRDVLLELMDTTIPGWARVKRSDGVAGYVRVTDLWGA